MRKRFDPSYLEPKDGDFASFVEKLNQKSVQELKALQVNDEQMREIRSQINGILRTMGSGEFYEPEETNVPSGPARGAAARAEADEMVRNITNKPPTGGSTATVTFACPGAAQGMSFGNSPQANGGAMNPICLSCPKEEECLLASESK